MLAWMAVWLVSFVVQAQETFQFFVRLDDGFGGWFTAPELRVCGGGSAAA